MGITNAIGNAFSGLNAASRAAEIVSRNVSNATVEGYTAKSLALSTQVFGGEGAGVKIDGVTRAGDPLITASRRRADAAASESGAEAEVLRRLSDLLLDPDGEDSLSGRFGALEGALRTLADTPESASVQKQAAEAARGVADRLNMLSTETVRIRSEVDKEIERQVSELNRALARIEALNREIQSAAAQGRDATGLEDERDRMIDTVNGIVPIRATPKSNGGVSLSTVGGAVLLDGRPQEIGFAAAPNVEAANTLGGLTWNGVAASPTANAYFRGGSLEALFRARDVTLPGFSGQLDLVAQDVVTRFQSMPGYTGAGGAPITVETGLFTDGAARYDETTPAVAGLAGRIALNPAVAAPGGFAFLRTGDWPGAIEPPATGAAAFPTALYDAFTTPRAGSGLTGVAGPRDPVALVDEFAALTETAAGRAESETAFRTGAATAVRAEEKTANGVDTDAELRNLLAIEKAYAANARVLQTADAMLALLLEI
jgi:flagellar hook-associated protein 1 FlgK